MDSAPLEGEGWTSLLQQLASRYVSQMLHGCGNALCKETTCDTGRRNLHPDRLVRRWSSRSARLMAVALLSTMQPHSHLCKHMPHLDVPRVMGSDASESPQDPAALVHILADAEPFRSFFRRNSLYRSLKPCKVFGHEGYRQVNLEHFHVMLDPLLHTPSFLPQQNGSSASLLSNEAAVGIISRCLHALLDMIPPSSFDAWIQARIMTTQGYAFCKPALVNGAFDWDCLHAILDYMDHEPISRLFDRILKVISFRTLLEDRLASARSQLAHIGGSTDRNVTNQRDRPKLLEMLVTDRAGPQNDFPVLNATHMFGLLVLLRRAVSKNWEGSPSVHRATSMCGALELMEVIYDHFSDLTDGSGGSSVLSLTLNLSLDDYASSWVRRRPGSLRTRELLSFNFLFDNAARAMCFRAVNHNKMRAAHWSSLKFLEFTQKLYDNASGPARLSRKLDCLQEPYLLLNVSRGNVLRDAFDQLWHRRTFELYRPIKVRLGEIDELEVGQDLGGVQIEFFNLICKEAFSDANQLFLNLGHGGLSYFRPMSLQPLHHFEMFGLLMSLAMYNGITLPVTLPLVFYELLLDSTTASLPVESDNSSPIFQILEPIRDGWPLIWKSLKDIYDLDIEVDWEFPLEANGLRLGVALGQNGTVETTKKSFNNDDIQSRQLLYVLSVTGIRSAPEDMSARSPPSWIDSMDFHELAFAWPGWHLIPKTLWNTKNFDDGGDKTSGPPATATTKQERLLFIQGFVRWLTIDSIRPQWSAFHQGFKRVIDKSTLSIFGTADGPRYLKAFVEGSATAPDLATWRANTRYDGYAADSWYMETFWTMVARWSVARQRGLLKFVTAAERLPLGGAFTFVIKRVEFSLPSLSSRGDYELDGVAENRSSPSTDHLPTSSTCFGMLQLPPYATGEILESKLTTAIEYGMEGFGTS